MEKISLKDIILFGEQYSLGRYNKEDFEKFILAYVSQDDMIISNMLEILDIQRQRNKELLQDTNFQLSRSLSGLMDFSGTGKPAIKMRTFMIEEIRKHYQKWKGFIGCCIRVKEWETEEKDK